jgi:UDP-GlcNAc:undecaprenyl-phosphate GlcNAc-1-phosphate transferase
MNLILFTFILSFILFLLFDRLSELINVYDYPNSKRKIHATKTSVAGGFVLFFLFNAILIGNFFYNNVQINFLFNNGYKSIFSVFFISFCIFFVGFLDDKFRIIVSHKIILLLMCISTSVLVDNSLSLKFLKFLTFDYNINLSNFSLFFFIFAIFVFINSVNMLDGIDLQCGLYFFGLLLVLFLKNVDSQIVFCLLIALYFILLLNYRKKTFLGNSGVFYLGYIFSIFFIKLHDNPHHNFYSEDILLLMILPGLEMIRLFFFRLINNKSPFCADDNHIHHLCLKRFSLFFTQIMVQIIIFFPFFFNYITDGNYFLILLIFYVILYLLIIKYLNYNTKT